MLSTFLLPLSLATPNIGATTTVLTLQSPKDFVTEGGAPLPAGYSNDASISTNAPFGVAIRSGNPGRSTTAAVDVQLSPGVSVEAVSFSYRQCTGFATTGLGPNFTLSVAGAAAFKSEALHGFPYKSSCPGGDCYSPPVKASASSLAIKVPSDGLQRIAFDFLNTGQNLQLLLPMNVTLTCSGPCTRPRPPPVQPNASAIHVACVGDSITQGYLSTNGATYPNQLQTMLGSGYKVENFGAGGRTMLKKGDNPYWTTGPLKQALAYANVSNSIVVLMLGTNDAKYGNWGPLHAEFPVDYKSMIDEFAALPTKPEIHLMVPPPLYQDGRYGMNQTVINTLFPGDGPAGTRTIAKNGGLRPPIDLFSLWQTHCPVVGGTPGHAPNRTDVPCDWIAHGTDACHPSNEGYLKLAEAVRERIVGDM